MKILHKTVLYGIVAVFFASSAMSQGLKLTQPNAVGGGLVFTNQDRGNNPLLTKVGAGPGLEFFVRYNINPKFSLSAATGLQTITDKILTMDRFRMTLVPTLEIKAAWNPMPENSIKPILFAGLSAFGWKSTVKLPQPIGEVSSDRFYDAAVLIGGGAEVPLSENIALSISGDYRYVFSAEGDTKPKFWVAKAGVSWALSKPAKTYKGEEIEYPMDEKEIASLDDLFKETPTKTGTKGTSEEDALSLLFQPDKATESGMAVPGEATESTESLSQTKNSEMIEYPDTDVGRLMARVQELKNEMGQKTQLIDDLQKQVRQNEKSIAELSGQVAGGSLSYGSINDSEFKSKYASALDKFYTKRYRDAIPLFEDLIKSNPRHFLASNCHYWIGESYNGLGDYRKAIDQFSTVLEYKSSYKLPAALIMSGVCYLKLGDSSTAREQFQRLINRYPDSEYAPKAMRYLGQL